MPEPDPLADGARDQFAVARQDLDREPGGGKFGKSLSHRWVRRIEERDVAAQVQFALVGGGVVGGSGPRRAMASTW